MPPCLAPVLVAYYSPRVISVSLLSGAKYSVPVEQQSYSRVEKKGTKPREVQHRHRHITHERAQRRLDTSSGQARPCAVQGASLLLAVRRLLHAGLAGRDSGEGRVLDAEHAVQHILHCGAGTSEVQADAVTKAGQARQQQLVERLQGVCSEGRQEVPRRRRAPARAHRPCLAWMPPR